MSAPSNLVAALIKAQEGFEAVIKDNAAKIGDKYGYMYADLASAIRATKPSLAANGLVVIQKTKLGPQGGVVLVTRLAHVSGESEEGEYPITPIKNDPQAYGSALTYARRYCYLAILGIAPEDDDGQAASQPAAPARARPAQQGQAPRQAPPSQANPPRDPAEVLDKAARDALVQALAKKDKRWADVAAWLASCPDPRAEGFAASSSIKDVAYGTLELIHEALAGRYKAPPQKARAS